MKKSLLIIIISILTIFPSYATGFGFRSEVSFLNTNQQTHSSLNNLTFGFKADISKINQIKVFVGFNYYSEEYAGISLSLLLETKVFKKIKIIYGLNNLFNSGVSHGTSTYTETYSKSFLHLVFGSGVNISPRFNIDLQFLLSLEKEFGFESTWINDDYQRFYKNHNYLLKIGIEYYFVFFGKN